MMDAPRDAAAPTDDTLALVDRARAGDRQALDDLFARHVPVLRRWAHGRLPRWARTITDTSDLVQETVLNTFKRLDHVDVRGSGALQAYLRQAYVNAIRDHLRRVSVRPVSVELDSQAQDEGTSPLDAAIGHEAEARYDAALARLAPEEREAIVLRVEFEMSYADVADLLGKPSPAAARMAVVRALVRLAEEMDRGPGDAG
jgi:RNA polymerase sigma factor (sigma-70 family)